MNKSSRLPRLGLALLLMLALVFSCAPVWAQAADVSAEVASVRGTITVKRAASEKTFEAFVGLKLKQGDVVTVAAGGEVAINIGADKTVKGLSDSSFKISNLSGTDTDSQAGFTLIKGTVFNEVRSQQSSSEGLTVRTGNTVASIRGTTYTVSLRAIDGVTVRTLKGSIFLDKVLARIEADANASLVGGQQTVGAGQGVSTTREGVYGLTMEDFTQSELEYITQHTEDFPPEMVSDAQTVLDNLPSTPPATPPVVEETKQIIYETATPSEPSGGSGGGSTGGTPAPVPAGFTVNVAIMTTTPYSTLGSTTSVTAQSITQTQLDALVIPLTNYSIEGWYTSNNPAGTKATFPITSNTTLYARLTGDGTNTPITIATGAELAAINDNTTSLSLHYQLVSDINLSAYSSGTGWVPIGDFPNTFTGSFDGNGHDITGLYINDNTLSYAGLFGYIDGGSVQNLTVGGSITTSADYVGGLAALCVESTISGCTSDVDISVAATYGTSAGGVVGSLDDSSITRCTGSGIITAASGSSNATYAGGIAGSVKSSVNGANGINSATNCIFTGSVTADATYGNNGFAGGIAGSIAFADLTNCYIASATIIASGGTTSNCAGGIVGSIGISGTVNSCVACSGSANGDASFTGRIYGTSYGTANYNYANDTLFSVGYSPASNIAGNDGADESNMGGTFWNDTLTLGLWGSYTWDPAIWNLSNAPPILLP